jgi:1-aminocyclopropane-1-carboxylate deaminase/D-cysteine desulfhydrase-like pyridoxal-dependent ACC family enzyme
MLRPFALPAASFPTPVLATALPSGQRLWLKHDGLSHPLYGGNKVRKIGGLLDEAERRGARRLLTLGAAGSHYVLATALFARARGLEVAAVLMPQPVTPHVLDTFRATLALRLELSLVSHVLDVPQALLELHRPGDYLVPAGGSNRAGARGYADAAGELAEQIRRGELPEPDLIVVPVGSCGTAAGLLAGLLHHGLKSRVLGVSITQNALARPLTLGLASRVLHDLGSGSRKRELDARFELDRSQLGRGYGHSTPQAEAALELGHGVLGLELDLTYTAKAFAATVARLTAPGGDATRILYWHTLSSASLEPLLVEAPSREAALARMPWLG